jgi:hypothetical protein
MISRRIALSTSLLAGVALAIGVRSLSAAAPVACESGSASGTWELPSGSGTSDGYIDGFLYLDPSPGPATPRYYFSATLSDTPTPCLSCIAGEIDGYLDDGFGPAPDYVVKGAYQGLWLSGNGTFAVKVFLPGGSNGVGEISGKFADPPASTVPGTFKGAWEICP